MAGLVLHEPETTQCPWCNTDTVRGYELEHLTDACLDVPKNLRFAIWKDWGRAMMMGRP